MVWNVNVINVIFVNVIFNFEMWIVGKFMDNR